MFLKLDENHYIKGYATIGGIEGAIEVELNELDIPYPYYEAYQYLNGRIILDEDRLSELIEAEKNQPLSETDELKKRIAKLEAMVETLLKDRQI